MDKQVKNYVDKFMAELIAKNPGEKEFHQAVSEVVESVAPYILQNPYLIDQKIMERIVEPERVITFVHDVLQAEYHCIAAVCGFNYRFGKAASGNAELLKSLMNGSAWIREAVMADGEPISSTRIRRLLSEGQVEQAANLLTEPYSITAEVLHGKKLGRSLGFPTVNRDLQAVQFLSSGGLQGTFSFRLGHR